MSIRQSAPPNRIGQPSVEFDNNSFEAAIWNKGYDIKVEKAIECPCKSSNGNVSTCQNCFGYGWIYINPIRMRAITSSVNYDTKYKDWTREKLGTISVTVRNSDRISYYDRLTFENDYSIFAEIRPLLYNTSADQNFIFTTYQIKEIEDVFLYESDTDPLIKLTAGTDYSINENNPYILDINYDTSTITNFNSKVSIRYKHRQQYLVLDLPHDMRRSLKINENGQDTKIELPVNAIAARVHNVRQTEQVPNFDGTGVIDNSYL